MLKDVIRIYRQWIERENFIYQEYNVFVIIFILFYWQRVVNVTCAVLHIAVEINDVNVVDIIFIYYNEIGNTVATENQYSKIKYAL